MNTDQLLFKELDKYSDGLRQKANEIAILFTELPVKSPEIDNTIRALQKVHSGAIDRMDVAINEVRDAFLLLSMKIKKDSRLLDSPVFHSILEKNFSLAREAHALEEKALELNRTCED